ncbi:MAG TPA: hypothetical protein VMJ49_06080, partial [Gaiellaceae bacterium]|nr:hypothetical protein [Gaiellaceae bacterium]
RVDGGQELSSYPARCVLTGERRTIPGETVADVERELRAVAGDATLRTIASRDPYEAPSDDPFVELVARAAGIPTVLFGPSGEGAHAEVEWVDVGSLELVRDVVLRVAAEWCA